MSINSPFYGLSVDHRGWSSEDWSNEPSKGFPITKRLTFTEAAQGAAGTYTGIVNLPPGALVHNIVTTQEALWTDTTSASLQVGDHDTDGAVVDADGFYTAVDLKATDLLADERVDFSAQGGVGGAYLTAGTSTHITNTYFPDGGQIRATVAAGAGDGTAGVTHVDVVYSVPQVREASFVAS